jgi:flagellar basal-body rod protein FlgF
MDRALYIGMTGASQILQAQAVTAQNLANVSTDGFRADLFSFTATPIEGPGYATRINAVAQSSGFSAATGAVSQNGNPLSVSIRGNGYLAVQAKDGSEAYTRAGDLHLTPDGTLVSATGLPVLSDGGQISIPPSDSIAIGADGTITSVPQGVGAKGAGPVGRLKLVNPPATQLAKGADGLLRLKNGTTAPVDSTVQVQSGSVESSNVNAPHEMVEMIQLSRLFEMQTRLINSTDQNEQTSQKLLSLS